MTHGLPPVWVAGLGRHTRLRAIVERSLIGGLLLTLSTASVQAQAPLGQDFQVNQTSIGFQMLPEVVADSDRFSVVWDEAKAAPDLTLIPAIRMRDYSAGGIALGAETVVAGPEEVSVEDSSVAIAPNGSKLVIWAQSVPEGQVPFRSEVFGTLYNRAGEPVFSERRLNTYEPGDQIPHAVAADGDSNFIVVWESDPIELVPSQDRSGHAAIARRISSSGDFLGPELRVNTFTRGDQWPDSVAAAPDGRFVIVWTSVGQDGSGGGVYGQLFGANGKPIGSEFRVNHYTAGWQQLSDVAMDRWGNFVVVWQSQGQDGSSEGVYARRFRSDGRPRGSERRVKSNPLGAQETPRIAMDSAGNFVVVWTDWYSGPSFPDVMARAFWANGRPVGKEFIVNSGQLGEQQFPDVALSGHGTMMVVWQDYANETPPNVDNGAGVFGRRFATPFPSRCEQSETTLCLRGGRFRVEANWSYPLDENHQAHGLGQPLKLREDTGAFSFFEPSNLELLVKVLDGCAVNGNFWFFAGGLTNAGVDLMVVDTATGEIRVYRNPARTPFRPVQDTSAFAGCGVELDPQLAPSAFEERAESLAARSPDAKRLSVGGGRYEVTASWRKRDGSAGAAGALPIAGDAGAFWFFDDNNLELLVKVIDGCGVNGRHWIFASGLTNVEVNLTVHDRVTDEVQTYHNPAGIPFQPLRDTQHFSCQ